MYRDVILRGEAIGKYKSYKLGGVCPIIKVLESHSKQLTIGDATIVILLIEDFEVIMEDHSYGKVHSSDQNKEEGTVTATTLSEEEEALAALHEHEEALREQEEALRLQAEALRVQEPTATIRVQEEDHRVQEEAHRVQELVLSNNDIIRMRSIAAAREAIALRGGNLHFELQGRLASAKSNMTYKACIREFCRKKVVWNTMENIYQCLKCRGRSTTFYRALMVVIEIMNDSGRYKVVMFDDDAVRFLGKNGHVVSELEGRYGDKLARDRVIEKFIGRYYKFVILATSLTRWILSSVTPY